MRKILFAAILATGAGTPGMVQADARDDVVRSMTRCAGYTDDRIVSPARISKRRLPQWVKGDQLLWIDSGLPGGGKGFVSTFAPAGAPSALDAMALACARR